MAWTDDRLDDFAGRVSADIRELRGDFRDVRTEIRDLRTEMRAESASVRAEVAELRLLVGRIGGGMLIAQFGMIAALVAAVFTRAA